jgi:fluoride exporter
VYSPLGSQRSRSRPLIPGDRAYDYGDDIGNLTEVGAPDPIQNKMESHLYAHEFMEDRGTDRGRKFASLARIDPSQQSRRSPGRAIEDSYTLSDKGFTGLTELNAPPPVENRSESPLYRHRVLEEETSRSRLGQHERTDRSNPEKPVETFLSGPSSDTEEHGLTALPLTRPVLHRNLDTIDDWNGEVNIPKHPIQEQGERISHLATHIYTISYLVFFAILGTLARVGLSSLTFYSGAPVVFGVLWANFSGSFVLGFLTEDRHIFWQEWGDPSSSKIIKEEQDMYDQEKVALAKSEHLRIKKTIPMYIGLATGFCGSLTSFSAFMRDVFLALSNNLPTPVSHLYPAGFVAPSETSTIHRNGGYSFMAMLAVIILTLSLSLSALKIGAHLAIFLDPYMPSLPYIFIRKVIDRAVVFIAFGSWLGAILLSIWPPDRPDGPSSHGSWDRETWRGQVLFAIVFAPLGCLIRFYTSLKLNGIAPSFPLGTFAVNIFGTAVQGMAYDLQHVELGSTLPWMIGGGQTACQVLQGIMDGFDGCLTTVSTFVAELSSLRRTHSYIYGTASVMGGLCVLIVVMGSVRWSVGWRDTACVTP